MLDSASSPWQLGPHIVTSHVGLRESCWLHAGAFEKISSPKSEAHLLSINDVLFIETRFLQAGFTGLKHTEEVVDNTIAAARAVMKDIAK